MMHPDQLYSVRQLQQQDLLAEAEQARVCQELSGSGAATRFTWLAPWLKRVSRARARRATSSVAVERRTSV